MSPPAVRHCLAEMRLIVLGGVNRCVCMLPAGHKGAHHCGDRHCTVSWTPGTVAS